jgi:hypothetical protein
VGHEAFHETELRRLAFLGTGAGGQVKGDQGQVSELGLKISAFGVDIRDAETLDDPVGPEGR